MAKAKFPKRLGEYNTYLIAAVPYLNPTNPALNPESKTYRKIIEKRFHIA